MSKKIVLINKSHETKSDNPQKTNVKKAVSSMANENFEELFEQSMTELSQGQIVTGRIASLQSDLAFVDVGYKSEGKIKLDEFSDEVKVGDEVEVMIMNMEDSDGNVVLSKRKADMIVSKELIGNAFKNNEPVEGRVIKEVKGGYAVNISGVEAFLPGSQMDIRRADPKSYIGNKYTYKISRYEPSKGNIILSRRTFLEEQLVHKLADYFTRVKEGDVVKGKVKNILDYGAFIELEDGIDGFLHLKEMSWTHIKNCKDVISEGQDLELQVIKLDQEQKKINLGLKQLQQDPWDAFIKSHNVNDILEGEVMRLTDFGAFVQAAQGIDGLVHVKEMSWTKKVNHPKEILKVGDKIQAMIIEINEESRKLSLSLRQVMTNPWDEMSEKFPKGKRVTGTIKNITNFGVFVELEEDIVGLLHSSDVDWTKRITDMKKEDQFKKGDSIDVVVLEINQDEKTISLGVKQMLDNPWEIFRANHPKGSEIKGKVTKVLESGVIVALDDDMEGFLHASEMIKKREDKVEDLYKQGDEITALVKSIDMKKARISLSKREYDKLQEQKTIDQYMKKDNSDDDEKVTLGDLINFNKIKE